MSAYSMKPVFSDLDGYRRWKTQWKMLYKGISTDIHHFKRQVKNAQRKGTQGSLQKQLRYKQVMASKAMTLLQEARDRWKRLMDMRHQISEQMATFPLIIDDCRTIDFHYNKGSNIFPELPKWVLRTKGKTFYVHHIDAQCSWTTRELMDGSTKGMLRFRNCRLIIDEKGEAKIENINENVRLE